MSIGSISSSSASYYQDDMKSIQQASIAKIEDDLSTQNKAVQDAGNPDSDPNDVDPNDQT